MYTFPNRVEVEFTYSPGPKDTKEFRKVYSPAPKVFFTNPKSFSTNSKSFSHGFQKFFSRIPKVFSRIPKVFSRIPKVWKMRKNRSIPEIKLFFFLKLFLSFFSFLDPWWALFWNFFYLFLTFWIDGGLFCETF